MSASRARLHSAATLLGGPLLVTLGLLLLGATSASGYGYGVSSTLAIDLVALVGLNLMAGHAGQLSLGHAGLFGAGAYAVVIGGTHHGLSGIETLVLATAVGAALAVVIGIPTLRLKGLYFAVGTLAFAVIIDYVDSSAVSLTGGPDGVTVAPLKLGPVSYAAPGDFFHLVVVVAAVALVVERLFVRTWLAWGVRAARASEPAAASAGIPVFRSRLATFALSGAFAGLAGGLFAYQTQYVSPSSFGVDASINFFVVLFIGGTATFLGPVVGAVILYAFARWLAPHPDAEPYVLAAFFLLTLRFFPAGLSGAARAGYDRWRARARHGRGEAVRPVGGQRPASVTDGRQPVAVGSAVSAATTLDPGASL